MPSDPPSSSHPRVHFVFAIENKPAYINMARLLAYSIRHRAGALANSKITVVFNDVDDNGKTAEFLETKLNTECLALPRVSHELHYLNKYTALHTPKLHESEWVIQLDADIAVLNTLDELEQTLSNPALDFAGVPTLVLPVWGLDRIFQKYTGLTKDEINAHIHPYFPKQYPYFNGGVIIFRTTHLPLFRDTIVTLGEDLRNWMRIGGGGPVKFIRNRWNRCMADHPKLNKYVIAPYYPRNAGDQLAIPVLVLKHHLKYQVLPHIYNWRSPDVTNQGPTSPIRILHYLGARFPIDRANLFNPHSDWLHEYLSSANPGQNALANLIQDYNNWNETPS